MNYKKINRWFYWFAALPLALGCALIMLLDFPAIINFPSMVKDRYNLDNLTQVIVPGSGKVDFPKAGAYAVYYEYNSTVNGMKFDTGKEPPSLECDLISKNTGTKIRTVPDYVETNTYSTKDRDRVGVLIKSITIQDPGAYSFACDYQSGKTQPEIVVSVGPNFMWEFFKISWEMGRPILGGLAIIFCSVTVSLIVVLIITLKRSRFRKELKA